MLKWAHYARKLDFALLCPNMEIRPQAPKNGIFQNFFIFVERTPDFASNEPSTTPRHEVKVKLCKKTWFWRIMPKYGKSATGSQKLNF